MEQVLDFWFREIERGLWFKKLPAFDDLIRQRFLSVHQQITKGELEPWRQTPRGALAYVIVLDQFSRNMFRDTPAAFASDALALAAALDAVDRSFDRSLDVPQRGFLYMPLMHSESVSVHQRAIALFGSFQSDQHLKHALRHKAIIDRFGRYPHRNKILGRVSTDEELAFLQTPGSSF